MTSEDKSDLSFCSSIGKVIFFPLTSFKIFLWFSNCEYDMPRCSLCIYLASCPLRFPNLVCNYFGKFLSIYCFKYYFCSFLSFISSIPIIHMSFVVVPQFLNILFFSFFSLFSFLFFHIGSFFWHISSSNMPFSAVSSLIMSSSKASSFLL